MKKQWKLDNKGMTLLEVIVAFAIFAIAATILITGFNGALKVMGNSEAIKDASQKNASGLESPLEVIEEEGYTVKKLDAPTTATFTYDGKMYVINGSYIKAISTKSNDSLAMEMALFEADALGSAETPETPETPDAPVITPPSSDKAYYDNDRKQYPYNSYIVFNTGTFCTQAFDDMAQDPDDPNNKWLAYRPFGRYFSSLVVTDTPNYPAHGTTQAYYENVKQIYFIGKPPMTFSTHGGISYAVKLCYIGTETEDKTNIDIEVKYDYTSNQRKNVIIEGETNQFILNTCEGNQSIILYLPKPLTITAKCTDYANTPATISEVTLSPGFYALPSGTDLFKITYDTDEKDKYSDSSATGYYRPDMTEAELKKMGIEY
ncbi:prepilin-type N-terminal cleavage/methylation domain-containing protein [Eubacterium sp. 1001713B170207_170306_E7]|uniref:prepilin-type N-terminal cleavage/methylation domain-containing protein n=1 Tax=Eubacterium sp. 1001713B170207_170306_E7 TaxID=2787097 RepID=UPI0018983CAC|nr:prepilin-type N-terminal cleavage/methylation domain-containing protein [Eubacterium sp. 1001713B170207_170306_E7]